MKLTDLTHSHTPDALRDLNQQIVTHLNEHPDSDFSTFNTLITKRDAVIRRHLAVLAPQEKQTFVNLELDVNNKLQEVAQSLLGSAKEEISQFVRSQASIKKYK